MRHKALPLWLAALTCMLVGGCPRLTRAVEDLAAVPCADGSRVVQRSQVDDDFCDCPDGSDELHTAACAGLPGATFLCDNAGFFSLRIPTSRVADGICDCCDGSDEAEAVGGAAECANRCQEEGRAVREDTLARVASISAAIVHKHADAERRAQQREAFRREIEEWQQETERLRARLAQEQHALARAEGEERQQRQERGRRRKQAARTAAAEEEGGGAPATCADAAADDAAAAAALAGAGDSTHTSERTSAASGRDDAAAPAASAAGGVGGRADVVQEPAPRRRISAYEIATATREETPKQRRKRGLLTPWLNATPQERTELMRNTLRGVGLLLAPVHLTMWGAARALQGIGAVSAATQKVLPDVVSTAASGLAHLADDARKGTWRFVRPYVNRARRTTVGWAVREAWEAFPDAYDQAFPALDEDWELPEAVEARRMVRESEEEIAELEQRVRDKQRELEEDEGPARALSHMRGRCYEKQQQQYLYKVCPFDKAHQDNTLLGKWEPWSAEGDAHGRHLVWQFLHGTPCWNGPSRKLDVRLTCAEQDEVLSVEEPNACEYAMQFGSPLACTAASLREAADTLRQLRASPASVAERAGAAMREARGRLEAGLEQAAESAAAEVREALSTSG